MTPPRLGVNYVPSAGWWYCWVDWDARAIAADLASISELGADHVRIHCLWPVFQPNPSLVSAKMVNRLTELLDLADLHGLDVVVTVFDGWLSGFDFRPSWLDPDANIFATREVIQAQRLLLRGLADHVADHPRFLGFDLANEPNVIAGGPGRDRAYNVITSGQGDAWVGELLEFCEQIAPGGLHSVGMDHRPWLAEDEPFTRPVLATTGAITPVHAWIYFTGALDRYGPTGTGTTHLAEFLLELAKAYNPDPTRPVWLQEYGASTEWLEDPAAFLGNATRAACSVSGLWGLTWWCSHDIDRRLGGFADLEYDLGLLTIDNQVKPAGARFREMCDHVRSGQHPAVARDTALVLPEGTTPDLTFADAFFALIDQGIRPAIVLSSQAAKPDQFSARGISRMVHPDEALHFSSSRVAYDTAERLPQ